MKSSGQPPKTFPRLPGEVTLHAIFGGNEFWNTDFLSPRIRPFVHAIQFIH